MQSYERFGAHNRDAMQYEIDANAAKFKAYERQKLAAKLRGLAAQTLASDARQPCVAAATLPTPPASDAGCPATC